MLSDSERTQIEEIGSQFAKSMASGDDFEISFGGDLRLEDALKTALNSIRSSCDFSTGGSQTAPNADSTLLADINAGAILHDYQIVREIGRGGMGIVYEAIQASLQRRVALKLLPTHGQTSEHSKSRFRLEARAAARLKHDHIVRVYDVGMQNEVLYYAMDFVEGVDLNSVVRLAQQMFDGVTTDIGGPKPTDARVLSTFECALSQSLERGARGESDANLNKRDTVVDSAPRHSNLSTKSVTGSEGERIRFRDYVVTNCRLIVDVARALQYAHECGVIHRDIKPSNLLLDEQGRVWVTDFGLAKLDESNLTRTGDIVGTLRYMSPERFSGMCDETADVYSLGLTLYEMLARRPAFQALDRASLVDRVVHDDPTLLRRIDPRIPFDLETIVCKAIAKEPDRRYATAAALADDVQRFLDGVPIQARQVQLLEKLVLWSRKNPTISVLLSLFVFILAAVSIGSVLAAAEYRAIAQAEKEASDQATIQIQNAQRESEISNAINSFFNDDILGQADVNRNVKDLTVRQALLVASQRIDERFTDMPVVEGEIRRTIGRSLAGLGKFEEGTQQLLRSQDLLENALGRNDPKTVETVGQLAQAYRDWERYSEASPYAERYLEAVRSLYGSEAAVTYQAMHLLAMNMDGLDQHEAAVKMLQDVVEWRRRNLGTEHPDTIRSILELGAVYLYADLFELAEPLVTESAELAQKILGNDNYVTLIANDNLSYLCLESGRYDDAERVIQNGIELTRTYFGESHPSFASTIGKLSTLYAKTGRLEEALEARRRNVELTWLAFGPQQSVTFNTRFELANLMRHTQRFDEADQELQGIIQDARNAFGDKHEFLVIAEGELGQLDFSQKDYQAAREHFEKAYQQALRDFGETSFTLTYASLLGNAGWMLGDYALAAEYWKKSLQDEINRGVSLTRTLPLSRQVAMAELKLGDYAAAKSTIAQAMPRFSEIPSEASVMVGEKYRMLLDLTGCHLKLAEYAEAERVAREIVAFEDWPEGTEYRRFRGQVMLGAALLHQDQLEQAEKQLIEGYQALLAVSAGKGDQQLALETLLEFYKRTNQQEERERYETILSDLLVDSESSD